MAVRPLVIAEEVDERHLEAGEVCLGRGDVGVGALGATGLDVAVVDDERRLVGVDICDHSPALVPQRPVERPVVVVTDQCNGELLVGGLCRCRRARDDR